MSKPPETLTRIGRWIEDAVKDLMTPTQGEEQLSRFDSLLALRDELVSTINVERPQELQRLKDLATTMKKALAGTSKRLRDVTTVTKPRGPRKKSAQLITQEKEKESAAV